MQPIRMKMLQRICFLLAGILAFAFIAEAQSYNNEWINFNNTYYKFKVGKDGLYRIPETTLRANGLQNTPAQNFRLYRNGVEVPLYTSVPSGQIPVDGYIEFWGKANDGEPDRPLYRDARFQHSTRYNLHSDTAVYFLTAETGSVAKRFQSVANNIAANTLPAEPYFLHTVGAHFKQQINTGFAADLEQYVYSSSYDRGEFWSSTDIRQRTTRTENLSNLKPVVTGPDAVLRFGAFGNTVKTRTVRAAVNGTTVKDTVMNFFSDLVTTTSFSSNLLSSGSAAVAFTNVQPPAPPGVPDPYLDRMVLSFYELTYPREFDFGNASQFSFELEARTAGYYLEIKNFNAGGSVPVLYDTESRQRYTADVQAGVYRFALTGTANRRKMILVSQAASVPIAINSLTEKKFVDFSNTTQQGNYLIISHPSLYNGTGGNNPVEEYRAYRSSSAGGGYAARTYDIHELVDQFAFGIKGHPSSIKNFIRYARANFSQGISNVFIIGKGVTYTNFRSNPSTEFPLLNQLNLVPTFGFPGSDNMLGSENGMGSVSLTPIGRLSVIRASEVENYLEKVKEYEAAQRNSPQTLDGRLWMKNTLHVTGATDALLSVTLCNYMQNYRLMLEDTLTGQNITVLCKSVEGAESPASAGVVQSLFQEGLSLLTYFGHSSANTLEFSIENPEAYNNPGKYPVMSVNGCYAGDFFRYSAQRFNELETLSEKFTLAKQRGGIAFLASTHFGVVNYLGVYLNSFYKKLGRSDYGATLGVLASDALSDMLTSYSSLDFLARTHAEQINLHGDPALVMNSLPKADYIIEEQQVEVEPSFIAIADENFTVKVKYFNIGKAVNDSIRIEVRRTLPNGSQVLLLSEKRLAAKYADSLVLTVPIGVLTDKGLNKIQVTIDGNNEVDEVSESNNTITKDFFIYEDELTPVFPYPYSIVSDESQILYASTADPFSISKQYVLEIDTTASYNSSQKKTIIVSAVGGLIEFKPQISYLDSTVYFWRTALVPTENNPYIWNQSSFLFKREVEEGFNQSHAYQHTDSKGEGIYMDSTTRSWQFNEQSNDVYIRQAIYPTASGEQFDFSIIANNSAPFGAGCNYNEMIFNVFDGRTFRLWENDYSGSLGLYESYRAVCGGGRQFNFIYPMGSALNRRRAMNFMDTIPVGSYVIVRNNGSPNLNGNTYASVWQSDTALYGAGNSLYHKLLQQGFGNLDSFNRPRAYIFVYRKNSDNSFTPVVKFSEGIYDKLALGVIFKTLQTAGVITSPKFGPAKKWTELRWNGRQIDTPVADSVRLSIIGVRADQSETVIRQVDFLDKIHSIEDINVAEFPFLKLQMQNQDTRNATPFQLDYWRLIYDPVPEGAVAPNLFFSSRDSVEQNELVTFGIAFKNISKYPFDSLQVKVILTDASNVPHIIPVILLKPISSGDTVIFRYAIDTRNYPGMNTLYVEFNPDNHQPEQYHFNNFIYRNLYVNSDRTKPLMDVTFDGVHILNGDIVSARPLIKIKLTDESRYLLLKDTSVLAIQVKFPDGSVRKYRYDNDTVRFTPAVNGTDNTASIDFTPSFLQTFNEDGMDNYELTVVGKDASGNGAGQTGYNTSFMVINKPMISNLLNYPNPFTTSTAFVFTITGSEIPANFKIQVLTITGKVVKEITRDELGSIRIGRNITDYKWDGTDQYGQRLANGVYLYRVVSTLHGKQLEKFRAPNENTDKFFTRGYGKMYLMR